MKAVLKSLLTGVLGAGLFFSFLMPITIAALAALQRLQVGDHKMVVVAPASFLQHVGLPMAALVFAASFLYGMRRFRPRSSSS